MREAYTYEPDLGYILVPYLPDVPLSGLVEYLECRCTNAYLRLESTCGCGGVTKVLREDSVRMNIS